jgi:tRNA(Arg) A34 adenosine deaminase TadA
MDDKRFMMNACDLAEFSVKNGGGPFGAVIVSQYDVLVGKGHNMVTINNDPTQHAEIVAIRDACKKLDTYDLTGHNIYTSCEPCPMCMAAIYWAKIDNVYYGNTRKDAKAIGFNDDFIYEELSKPIENRKIKMIQIERDIAQKSFRQWDAKSDKKEY